MATIAANAPWPPRAATGPSPQPLEAQRLTLSPGGGSFSMRNLRICSIRALLWGGMQAASPGITLQAAGDLLGRIVLQGSSAVQELSTRIMTAVAAAFPPPEGNADAGDAGARIDWAALHGEAVEAGLDPERAWLLTPRQIARESAALARRRSTEMLVVAWHTAAFMRQRRLPRLETLLRRVRRRRQTAQQQLAPARLITAMFSGEQDV